MNKNLQINETERWWNSKNIYKFAKQYQKNYSDKNVVLYQNSRMNKVYELLSEEKFNNILEIGFGAGQLMSKIIIKNKVNYYGIDISKPLFAIAKKRIRLIKSKSKLKSKINLSLKNIDQGLKFKSGKFDMIVAVGVFHYSSNLNKSLREVHRILKKGGTFIIAQRSGYAMAFLFNLRYLIRSLIYILSNEKFELFPSFKAIFCESKLGKFFKRYKKSKFFNSKFMIKNHDFYKYKIQKHLMTPKLLKKNLTKSGFTISKFEGALFEISLKNQKINTSFDKFIKFSKLSWLFKKFSSVLVFKVKKL